MVGVGTVAYQLPGPVRSAAVNRPDTPTAHALTSVVAGLAVALSATSLTGVLAGPRWWSFVLFTIALVVTVGVALRSLRLPALAVATGQVAALTGLVTATFTDSGVLVVLPGPDAMVELRLVLGRAVQQVQVGVPVVAESTELLCLVMLSFGLIALIMDTVAVSAAAPAASGLVLLCVVAVPAALADHLLPWWTFILGTLGFAALLATNGQCRRLAAGEPTDLSSAPVGPTSRQTRRGSIGGGLDVTPVAAAVGAGATVMALLAGATLTAVGTEGRIVDVTSGRSGGSAGIGLNAFTSLRGHLEARQIVELFRVRGLGQRAYLRALTLSHFTPGQGWHQGPLDGTVPAGGGPAAASSLPLPSGVTGPVAGPPVQVQIEPIGYVDYWLPSFGYPLHLGGIGADWRYDPNAITIFSEQRQRAQPYTEIGVLPQPDPEQLRAAGAAGGTPFTSVDPQYLDTEGVAPQVAELTAYIAAGAQTAFDATVSVNQWFTQPGNGFRYDLRTAPGNGGDALMEFLFTGRTGYCEQFASAMAVMLRTLGVPARVAVGFTPGTSTGDSWLITTDDAHAWVEAWFPESGWLPFDPTPLADGRTVVPSYVAETASSSDGVALPTEQVSTPATRAPVPVDDTSPDRRSEQDTNGEDGGFGAGTTIGLGIGGGLVLAALAGLTPLAVREARRRRRLTLVQIGGPEAASAAWHEVLAESADRGVRPLAGETVRGTARRLAAEHGLDEPGRYGLQVLIEAVELSWYGGIRDRDEHESGDQGKRVRSTGQRITDALAAVRASMARCAPITPTTRLLARSTLGRLRRR